MATHFVSERSDFFFSKVRFQAIKTSSSDLFFSSLASSLGFKNFIISLDAVLSDLAGISNSSGSDLEANKMHK